MKKNIRAIITLLAIMLTLSSCIFKKEDEKKADADKDVIIANENEAKEDSALDESSKDVDTIDVDETFEDRIDEEVNTVEEDSSKSSGDVDEAKPVIQEEPKKVLPKKDDSISNKKPVVNVPKESIIVGVTEDDGDDKNTDKKDNHVVIDVTEVPEKPKPPKTPEVPAKPEKPQAPEVTDKVETSKFAGLTRIKGLDKVSIYIGNKIDKGQFEITLSEARKDLNMPKLSIVKFVEATGDALMQNPQFGLNQSGGNSPDNKKVVIDVDGMTKEEYFRRKEIIRKKSIALLEKHNFDGKSDAEKSMIIHDIVINLVDYDHLSASINTDMDHELSEMDYEQIGKRTPYEYANGASNVYTGLTENRAICGGYARLYQLLSRAVGLESFLIEGPVKTGDGYEDHAWNWVKLDGEYYVVDTTWDDIQDIYFSPGVEYKWLNMPVEWARKERGHEKPYFPEGFKYTEGKSYKYTWFSMNNMTTTLENAKKYIFNKIDELNKSNSKEANKWVFQVACYELDEKDAWPILEDLNKDLDNDKESIAFYNHYFEYVNYEKFYGIK